MPIYKKMIPGHNFIEKGDVKNPVFEPVSIYDGIYYTHWNT